MSKTIGSLEPASHLRRLVYSVHDTCPALVAGMGLGGGFVPMIVTEKKKCHTSNKQPSRD